MERGLKDEQRPPAPRQPAPGPRDTVASTPGLAASAARRTTSTDIARPDGLLGRVLILIHGRDVLQGEDQSVQVADEIHGTLQVDARTSEITAVELDGGRSPVPGLAGLSLRRGWGRSLASILPDERRSLLRSALEDLGGAYLVSGYALLRGGLLTTTVEQGARRADAQRDVCIGWADEGDVVTMLRTTGDNAVPMGPPAAPAVIDDQWHPLAAPEANTVRRLRRLDVSAGADGPVAQAHFRDSYASDGPEMVMHEYLVDTRVDTDGRITSIHVEPRVLPWATCPGAVASARQIVGATLAEIPGVVRRDLNGPTTCTHLTSTLRSIADAEHLVALVGA